MRIHTIPSCLVLIAFMLFTGCRGDASEEGGSHAQDSSGEQVHPDPERLPHADGTPTAVSDAEPCDLSSVPASLERLQAHIDGNDAMADAHRIPVDVPDTGAVEVASLNEELVLILVTVPRISELWSYHIPTDTAERVAPRGQGPGELMFPSDLAVQDSEVYVSMGSMRIATFTCEGASCRHRKDIRTQFQPTQIEVTGDRFATTGQLPLRGETDIDALDGAIHHVDSAGALVGSFGEPYQTNTWMVNAHFARHNRLTVLDDGSYAVHYDAIPRLYTYNSDETLRHVIEIEDFLQPTFVYEDGSRSVYREDDHSRLGQLNTLVDDVVFLSASTVQLSVPSESIGTGDAVEVTYDYYLMGATSGCVSQIGTERVSSEYGDGVTQWLPTKHHLLRIGEGSVHLAELDGA